MKKIEIIKKGGSNNLLTSYSNFFNENLNEKELSTIKGGRMAMDKCKEGYDDDGNGHIHCDCGWSN